MVWAFVVSVILAIGILFKVKDEVTRFTLIMPIFAGFILFSILITPDEELDGEFTKNEDIKKSPLKKKSR